MSNRKGARTGLDKPREVEAELLAEQWRENGGALRDDRQRARNAFSTRVIETALGHKMPAPRRVNHLVHMLLIAGGALDDGVLTMAAERLAELGLDGDDYEARIEALAPPLPDVAMLMLMEQQQRAGASERAAAERVAATVGLPAASHDAAAKQVRRTAKRVREKFRR